MLRTAGQNCKLVETQGRIKFNVKRYAPLGGTATVEHCTLAPNMNTQKDGWRISLLVKQKDEEGWKAFGHTTRIVKD